MTKFNLNTRLSVLVIFLNAFVPTVLLASITVSPEIQNVSAKAGKKAKAFIIVSNPTKELILVDVQPEDWSSGSEQKKEVSWLNVSPGSFEIKPGRSVKVKIQAKVPAVQNKVFQTQIFFAERITANTGLSVGLRVGSMIRWKVTERLVQNEIEKEK